MPNSDASAGWQLEGPKHRTAPPYLSHPLPYRGTCHTPINLPETIKCLNASSDVSARPSFTLECHRALDTQGRVPCVGQEFRENSISSLPPPNSNFQANSQPQPPSADSEEYLWILGPQDAEPGVLREGRSPGQRGQACVICH